MKDKLYIGIDNGSTGTIGCIINNDTFYLETPTKTEQNYTKKKSNVTRIDFPKMLQELSNIIDKVNPRSVMCLVERPMVNPKRFRATTSALRALEATVNALEHLNIPFQYEDSKAWQRELLPSGSKQLKSDSVDIGIRLFPQHSELIRKHGDADGLLLAEYCRRTF